MYSFFIDTHDRIITVAIYKDGKVLDYQQKESARSHGDYTMPMVKDLLDKNNLNVHDLNEVLVINGPGSFTGVRIGVTIAKTLAYTLNIPIKAISSLEMYAISNNTKKDKIVIIRDIKGVFAGEFDSSNNIKGEFYYKPNQEFDDYIKTNNYEDNIIESCDIDFNALYEYSKGIETTIAHKVNPLYIKQIEVLKDDKKSNN